MVKNLCFHCREHGFNPSVQFSYSVVSNSLRPYRLQHARLPCPSPTPGVHPNSCPLNWWCHPTISSPITPFSSCLQSFPASGSFPMNQFFPAGGQSTRASASVLPMNIQDWFSLGWTGLILQSRVFLSLLQHRSSKASILQCWVSYGPALTSIHDHWKNLGFD